MTNQSSIKGRLARAAQLIDKGDLESAKAIVADLIEEDPNSADAWYLAAILSKTTDKKIENLNRALKINPLHLRARQFLAQLRPAEGRTAYPAEPPEPPVQQVQREEVRPEPPAEPARSASSFNPVLIGVAAFAVCALILGGVVVSRLAQATPVPSATIEVIMPPSTKTPVPTATTAELSPTLAPATFTGVPSTLTRTPFPTATTLPTMTPTETPKPSDTHAPPPALPPQLGTQLTQAAAPSDVTLPAYTPKPPPYDKMTARALTRAAFTPGPSPTEPPPPPFASMTAAALTATSTLPPTPGSIAPPPEVLTLAASFTYVAPTEIGQPTDAPQ